jgi:hypothetical protein
LVNHIQQKETPAMQYTLTITTESVEEICHLVSSIRAPGTTVDLRHEITEGAQSDAVADAPAENKTRKPRTPKDAPVDMVVELNPAVDAPVKKATSTEPVDALLPPAKPVAKTKALQPGETDPEVAKATLALMKAKDRQTALDLLDQFGVSHASQLKPEVWAEFIEAANLAAKRI